MIITPTMWPLFKPLVATPHSWVHSHAVCIDDVVNRWLVVLRPGSAGCPTLATIEYGADDRVVSRLTVTHATREKTAWQSGTLEFACLNRIVGALAI